jgi:hypothetical protein
MKHPWKVIPVFLLMLLSALTPMPAHAQRFFPTLPTAQLFVVRGRHGIPRFILALYAAQWENPFRVTVKTITIPQGQLVSGTFRVLASTPTSPLFEGSYMLTRRWSAGFWYNPIRGERLQKTVFLAGLPHSLNLDRDTDLADLHVAYDAPHGLSAQIGYYRESGTIHDLNQNLATKETVQSWNFWVTQRLDARWHTHLITPFVSAGYHPSAGLNHAVSILTGVAVTLNDRFSLSTSVWFFDLSNPATRVTAGLVVRL